MPRPSFLLLLLLWPLASLGTAFPERPVASAKLMSASYQAPLQYREMHERLLALFQKELGGQHLELILDANNSNINATASRDNNTWFITFYGGLLRHPRFNEEMFLITYCHELGHHLAGAPFKFPSSAEHDWISAEGQADYFATHVCMKRYYAHYGVNSSPPGSLAREVITGCAQNYTSDLARKTCIQSSRIAEERAQFHYVLTKDRRGKSRFKAPSFQSPSSEIANGIVTTHPSPQCRLDTYFQGALCAEDNGSHCDGRRDGFSGARPVCWFNP